MNQSIMLTVDQDIIWGVGWGWGNGVGVGQSMWTWQRKST